MGSHNQSSDEAMRSQRARLSLLHLATLVSPLLCQLQFSGGISSSSNSNGNSPSGNRKTNKRPTDVDEKFFFGGDGAPSLTGNQALDGGILGLGLGALGAAVLGPTIQGALNGGQQQSQGYSCGRRKRQANFGGSQAASGGGQQGQEIDGEERFFLPTGQGCTCNTNGRRRRQAPGENEPGTRFFGGLFGGGQQQQQQRVQQQLSEPGIQQPEPGVQQPEPGIQQPEPGVQQSEQWTMPVRLQQDLP